MDPKIVETELRNHKIREGPIYKRSKFLQEWRERWMVLTMNYILIFPNRNLKELAQFIDLREVKTYKSYLRKEEDMLPAGFKIRTLEDMFYFCARNSNEKWTWIVSLERLMDFKYAGKSPYNNSQWIRTKGFMGQREFERGKFDEPQFESPIPPPKPVEVEKPKVQTKVEPSKVNDEQLQTKLKKVDEQIQRLKQIEEQMHRKERQQQQIFLFELNKLKKTEESLLQLQFQVEEKARQAERIIAEGAEIAAKKAASLKQIPEHHHEEEVPQHTEIKTEPAVDIPPPIATEEIVIKQTTEQIIDPPAENTSPKVEETKPAEVKQAQTSPVKQSQQPKPSSPLTKTSSGISKRIEEMKNFFESKGTIVGRPAAPAPTAKKEEKKVEKVNDAVALNMCRDRVVVNLLEEFHPKAYSYPGLKSILEFLVVICSDRSLGYQSFLIREAKAHHNRFLFAQVLLQLINDYKKYDEFACIAKIVEVLTFEAPGIFKLNHFDLIKRKLVDLLHHAPDNHPQLPILLKTLYLVHKMKNLEKSVELKEKLENVLKKMISTEGQNWARKLLEDL